MNTIIAQTVKKRYVTWLAYSLAGLAFLVLYVALYPTLQKQAASVNMLLKSFPQPLLQAFGATDSLSNLAGLLVSKQYGLVWPMMAAVLAISFAGATLAGEIDSGTMGLTLALPVSRAQIYLAKYFAGIVGLLLFIVLSVISIVPVAAAFSVSVSFAGVLKLALVGFLFALTILSAGLMFSAYFSERGKVYALMGGILLLMYVLNIVALLQSNLNVLKYFTIVYYFNPGAALNNMQLDRAALLVFAGVIVVTTVLGIYQFNRRDISV